MKIAISAGHGSKIRGASDIIDEVDEARRVCTQVCNDLRAAGVIFAGPYFDDVSTSQNENLKRICDWHNSKTTGDDWLNVSVHFNANTHTSKPVGTECWYMTQQQLADDIATAIARASGLIDRGPKYSDGLYFLRHTSAPSVLLEICFVDSSKDVELYRAKFPDICAAIAQTIGGQVVPPPEPQPDEPLFEATGRCSWFGGPNDTGVSPSEGLAFIYSYDQRPDLFLPQQPPGTTGLARRLDPEVFYCACRWDYSITPKEMLADPQWQAIVRANGRELRLWPADWGPHSDTGRVCDLSPGAMTFLGIETDDTVEIVYPAPAIEPIPPEPSPTFATIDIVTSGNVRVTINGQLVKTPEV